MKEINLKDLKNVFIEEKEELSRDIPIPHEMVKNSLKELEKISESSFRELLKFREDLLKIRKKFEDIIETVNDEDTFDNYGGVDGGNGVPVLTMSGTFSSASAVWFSPNKKIEPRSKVTPIFLPSYLDSPYQNYIFTVRQKYEYLAAVDALKECDLVMMDGTIVPSIYARYLKSASSFDKITPKFIEIFSDAFIDKGKGCLLKSLMDSKNPVVGLPKRVRSQHIIRKRLQIAEHIIPENFTDLMVCTLLLKENEYIVLTSYKEILQGQPKGMGYWNVLTKEMEEHEYNEGGKNYISEAVRSTLVTYFKPYEGEPAIRIEIFEKDRHILNKILATIKKDYDRTVKLPFCIFMADRLSKSSSYIPQLFDGLMKDNMLTKLSSENPDSELIWFLKTISESFVFDEK